MADTRRGASPAQGIRGPAGPANPPQWSAPRPDEVVVPWRPPVLDRVTMLVTGLGLPPSRRFRLPTLSRCPVTGPRTTLQRCPFANNLQRSPSKKPPIRVSAGRSGRRPLVAERETQNTCLGPCTGPAPSKPKQL